MKGVTITPLKKIPDDRGSIFHIMRNDSPMFDKFGEVYVSTVYPGVVKAWHYHSKMTLNYAVVKGNIKLVVFDKLEFKEIYIGDRNYSMVSIKPGIWNGFMGIGTEEAMVVNVTDIPHDPYEIMRLPYDEFNYDWEVKNR